METTKEKDLEIVMVKGFAKETPKDLGLGLCLATDLDLSFETSLDLNSATKMVK